MKTEPKIVARTGVVKRPGCSYYLVGCDVWEREVTPDGDDRQLKVASAVFTREPGHFYCLDANGDIAAVAIPPLSPVDDDDIAKARLKRFFGIFERRRKPPNPE